MKNINAVKLGRLGGIKKTEKKIIAVRKNIELAREKRWIKKDKNNT